MARYATNDFHKINFAAVPHESTVYGPVTFAAVIFPSTARTGDWRGVMAATQSGGGVRMGMLLAPTTSALRFSTPGTEIDSTFTMLNADGWQIACIAKPSGSGNMRHSKYVFGTNTWTHETPGGTSDPPSVGAGGYFEVFHAGSDWYPGDIAAAAIWFRELGQSEVESLARGRWDMLNPEFLVEFPMEGDPRNDTSFAWARESSRYQHPLIVGHEGLPRSLKTEPPGFRYSPVNRRQ